MIVFTLPMPPSTNNLFINVTKGRIKSQKYAEWIMEAGYLLNAQAARLGRVQGPVKLEYEIGETDKRRKDVGNFEKAATDLLVSHGIIEADDSRIVREINLRWCKHVQGIQITITPIAA